MDAPIVLVVDEDPEVLAALTLAVEPEVFGGQAGTSSLVRNHPGSPRRQRRRPGDPDVRVSWRRLGVASLEMPTGSGVFCAERA